MNRRILLAALGLFVCVVGLVAAVSAPREAARAEPPVLDGAGLFTAKGCATCHGGPIGAGPPLLDVAAWAGERRDGLDARAYLTQSIREPGVFRSPAGTAGVTMPRLALDDDEVDRLVTYLLRR